MNTEGSPGKSIPEIRRIPRKRSAPALTDPFAHHVAHQAGQAVGALAAVLIARGVRALWLRYAGTKG